MIKMTTSAFRRSFRILYRGLLASLLICLLLIVGNGIGRALVQEKAEDFLTLFAEVYTKVLTYYVDEPKSGRLYRGALNGLAESLDPYSTVLSGDVLKTWLQRQQGEIACADIRIRKGSVEPPYIISVPNSSQAALDGLRAGDYIRKIDDKPTVNMSLGEVMAFLCGAQDSRVDVEVWRRADRESLTFSMALEMPPSATISSVLVDDVLVIRVPRFDAGVVGDLRKTLGQSNHRRILWDLRDNDASTRPELEIAQQCLALLAPIDNAGSLISMEKGEKQETDLLPVKFETQDSMPMAVLLNQGSSAATEWFAAVLHRHADAYLMGNTTFGKTLLQELLPLQEDLALWMSSYKIAFKDDDFDLEKGLEPAWQLPEEMVLEENQTLWEAATAAWNEKMAEDAAG